MVWTKQNKSAVIFVNFIEIKKIGNQVTDSERQLISINVRTSSVVLRLILTIYLNCRQFPFIKAGILGIEVTLNGGESHFM